MSNVLYLSLLDVNPSVYPFSGVMKKIVLHINAFKSYGNCVDYLETDEKYIYFVRNERKEIVGEYTENAFIYYNRLFTCAAKYIKKNRLFYDYIYVRHSALSVAGFKALSYIRRHVKRIYFEFPTYSVPPRTIKNSIKFFFNPYLKKYVDRIVLDCNVSSAYGIPTIMVVNGTDLSKIQPRTPTEYRGIINVVLVAYLQGYHGIEKIFDAIKDYYSRSNSRNVLFHIVGYGPKLDEYKRIAENPIFKEHMIFYGKKTGDELDNILNNCEIGISSLANKEAGVLFSSTLKSKEYLAKGIPVISDVMLDVFYENPKYFFYILNNEFNIDELVTFYDTVYSSRDRQEIIDEIRAFADQTCDMYKVLKVVDDDFNSSCK